MLLTLGRCVRGVPSKGKVARMEEKQAFLMTRARVFPLVDHEQAYDEALQVNVKLVGNTPMPLVALEAAATSSKTEQAPGDDDADDQSTIECY